MKTNWIRIAMATALTIALTVPLPAIIPVDAILAAMPQAVFKAKRQQEWSLGLQLAGNAGELMVES